MIFIMIQTQVLYLSFFPIKKVTLLISKKSTEDAAYGLFIVR